MLNIKFANDLVKQLSKNIPPELNACKKDLEKNFRIVLQNMFKKFDLITREEFDIQSKVLTKSRIKINQLEKRLAELEGRLTKSKYKKSEK